MQHYEKCKRTLRRRLEKCRSYITSYALVPEKECGIEGEMGQRFQCLIKKSVI